MALLGAVIRGVHSYIAIIDLIISLEPIVAPPQKFLSTMDHDPIIIY